MNEMNDQIEARSKKLNLLKEMGFSPYPHKFAEKNRIVDILNLFENFLEDKTPLQTTGRITRLSKKGKIAFLRIKQDFMTIQLVVSKNEFKMEYDFLDLLDIGDIIGVSGIAFLTRTSERSILVKSIVMFSKAVRPLPTPKEVVNSDGEIKIYNDFSNKEIRYRKRAVDLIVNKETRIVFEKRSKIINTIRNYLFESGYLEIQTPILQTQYGGANAKPFTTTYNSLGMDVFLRISKELYLKRCIIGGFSRVFEIGKDFRNEGIDRTHNPEFTMLEFYEANADYHDMMTHFENIYLRAVLSVSDSPILNYEDKKIDFSTPWKRLTFYKAIEKYTGLFPAKCTRNELKQYLKGIGLEFDSNSTKGTLLIKIFEEKVEKNLIQPHIIYDFPKESTPLCKRHRKNKDLVEQFEPYINGWEAGNAYTELNDPIIQRKLLIDQSQISRTGVDGYHPIDENFMESMEYGMPPTGGVGIGIDRMVMLLTNSRSIKDVLLFPLMRPEAGM